jgi:hypothetical protein
MNNRIEKAVAEEQVHARDMIAQLELSGLVPIRMAGEAR